MIYSIIFCLSYQYDFIGGTQNDFRYFFSYDKDLAQAAENIRILLQGTYARFNEATDPLIIEALIYRMKELETQYSFLIKKAKLERLCGEIGSKGDFV